MEQEESLDISCSESPPPTLKCIKTATQMYFSLISVVLFDFLKCRRLSNSVNIKLQH